MEHQLGLKLYEAKDNIYLVDTKTAIEVWPEIEEYVVAANNMGGGKFLPRHWLARILNFQADLFVNESLTTAILAEPQNFPTGRRIYVIVLMGSDGGCDWDSFGHKLNERAKQLNCSAIEVYGRKGWKKILEAREMKFAHCVWRKEL